jgi:hypothetical protein
MASKTVVEKLNEIRLAGLQQASESRDVDALMSWHSKDATFYVPGTMNKRTLTRRRLTRYLGQSILLKGREAVREFYANVYNGMPTFKVTESKSTGFTPEFVACEMKCEGQVGNDLPGMGFKAGDIVTHIGVSLFWWKWEGEGEWDGSLSEDVVRGWKVVEEHAYYQVEVGGRGSENRDSN